MTERKRFSQRRADALYLVVHRRITDLRIAVLKGAMDQFNSSGKENVLHAELVKKDLAAEVVAEYKRSYAKIKT